MGVLWHHSSVNLVKPRSIALAGPGIPRRLPEIGFRLAPPSPRGNRCGMRRSGLAFLQFRINHLSVIHAFGFNGLAGDDEQAGGAARRDCRSGSDCRWRVRAGLAFASRSSDAAAQASLTVNLPPAANVRIYASPMARGRPIVVIDAGHGGRDPGATSVSGQVREKQLTLTLAQALRDELVKRGRVRVAMTRDDDRYLTLDDRAAVARRLDAALFVSIHIDSAANPLARGASVYSLSDVASDAEAASLAARENEGADGGGAPRRRSTRCSPISRCARR